ncbi:glutamine synthetase/guanido kinase, partial [Ascobolus immersus RN42]
LKSNNIKFVRLQWVDYINMMRLRILPISQVLKALEKGKEPDLKVTAAVFSVLANNSATKKAKHGGVRLVQPAWDSLRPLWPNGRPTKQDTDTIVHGAVMCDLRVDGETEWEVDPRSLLRRKLETLKEEYGVSLRLGFEIEVVLLPWDKTTGRVSKETRSWGSRQATHSWSSAISRCMEEISIQLEESGIEILVLHPEATYGQFEFVLGAVEALESVDKLYHARQIIEIVANQYGYRATLHPKPLKDETGTGAHVHFSLYSTPSSEHDVAEQEEFERVRKVESFFVEGLLEHLQAFVALCLPTLASYGRFAAEGLNWSSSQWVCWGSDNKDAPLRMVEP